MKKNYFERLKNSIFDFIFPRRCVICDEVLDFGSNIENKYICSDCKSRYKYVFEFIKEPTCKKCGAMISDYDEAYCIRCKNKMYESFEYGFGLLRYNEYVKESLHKVKYSGRKEYLEFYGKCIARAFYNRIKKINPDCFVPVPIHKKRLLKRNYNQAAILSHVISNELKNYNINIPVNENIIFRKKNTVALNKLSEEDRKNQLSDAFYVNNKEGIESVIIIDDILTTGGTIDEMGKILKKNGVKKVYFIVISIVDSV